jgi:hypothetical protein
MFGLMFRGKDDAKLGRKPGVLRLRLEPNESDVRELYYKVVLFEYKFLV